VQGDQGERHRAAGASARRRRAKFFLQHRATHCNRKVSKSGGFNSIMLCRSGAKQRRRVVDATLARILPQSRRTRHPDKASPNCGCRLPSCAVLAAQAVVRGQAAPTMALLSPLEANSGRNAAAAVGAGHQRGRAHVKAEPGGCAVRVLSALRATRRRPT
jgi:hypothetical protein